MADFVTALDAALHGHYGARSDFRSPVGTRRGLKARMDALERVYGSQKAAAEAVGVYPNTWSKWKRGVQSPGPESLAKVAAGNLALLRAAKVLRKGYPSRIDIRAIVAAKPKAGLGREPKKGTYYNGRSPDAPNAKRLFRAEELSASQLADVVNAWAAGSRPSHVADVLLTAIERAYPGRFEFEGNDVTVTIVQ